MILIVIFIFWKAEIVQNAKILVVCPTPSFSHQIAFRGFTKDLLERGHKLTLVTTDPIDSNNSNITQIDLSFSYGILKEYLNKIDRLKDSSGLQAQKIIADAANTVFSTQLEYPAIQALINNPDKQKFDSVIVEGYFVPWFAMASVYNAPLILFTSTDTFSYIHKAIGNPVNPIIYPETPYLAPLILRQRFQAVILYFAFKLVSFKYCSFDEVIEKYFPQVQLTAEQLLDKVELLLTNTHPALGFVRPIVPTTIQLGFMHIEKPKPLSEDLQKFLDHSKNGVIYMSLGSNIKSSTLKNEQLQVFLNTFKALKYQVLWKWETADLPNKPDNVKISKWFPQADLLAHPKIKLFITQGGMQSLEEAIDRKVPMLAIPILLDQFGNAQRIVDKKIGLRLHLSKLSEDNLKKTIIEVIGGNYKRNIEKFRDLINDQPMTQREKAVWWIEYVTRHKTTRHLKYVGLEIPFYQKFWLDLIFVTILFLVIFALICKYLFKLLCRVSLKLYKMKKDKSKKD